MIAKIFLGCAVIPAAMLFGITSNLSSAIIVCGIVFVMTFVVYPNYWVHGGIIGIIMAGYIAEGQRLCLMSLIKQTYKIGDSTGKGLYFTYNN